MSNENGAAGTGHTARLSAYKNKGKDMEDMRRRRVETSVELRKAKKEETMLKRRNVDLSDSEPTSPLQEQNKGTMSMDTIVANMSKTDPQVVFEAVQAVRKLLSKERNPPINSVIEAGLVNKLVRFLEFNDKPSLQFEAAWALTNIASGTSEQTKSVVSCGAVPNFVRLLSSGSLNLVEQCVWALGNIAGDGSDMRDLVTSMGIVEPLMRLVDMQAPPAFLRNITWTFSNLCRNKNPPPKMKAIRSCLPPLSALIQHTDKEVLADTCWAFSYITDGANNQIQEVVDLPGIVPRLIELLGCSDPAVITPALRSVGNIVTGDDSQTQVVIDNHVLQMLPPLLGSSKNSIKKEACWMLSNITAGSVEQIQCVIDHNLVPLVVEVVRSGDFKSQKEAVWALTNLTSGGTVEQISLVVQLGGLGPMCDLLVSKDSKLLMVILDGLYNMLEAAAKVNQQEGLGVLIEECGGLDKIEDLQSHENEQVYKKSLSIIENYFASNEEDGEVAPEGNADTNQYEFKTSHISSSTQGFSF